MPTAISGMGASQPNRYGRIQTTPPLTSTAQKNESSTEKSSYNLELSRKARTLQREHAGKQEGLKQEHNIKKQELEKEYQQERRQLDREYEQKKRSMGISLYA